MSTRCHIFIKQAEKEIPMYHHHDGYPDGVGVELKDILKALSESGKLSFAEIVTGILLYDDEYEVEPCRCIHGDEEYIYYIDVGDTSVRLTCKDYITKEYLPDFEFIYTNGNSNISS